MAERPTAAHPLFVVSKLDFVGQWPRHCPMKLKDLFVDVDERPQSVVVVTQHQILEYKRESTLKIAK